MVLRCETVEAVRTAVREHARGGGRVALVPTMGALHAGHLSLVTTARAAGASFVVASIFVNPRQFGPGEDLDRYPRDLEGDLKMLAEAGVDAAFLPSAELMYPPGYQTEVSVLRSSQGLCGGRRPGHFNGVSTVVLKLLNIVRPSVAVFGEKDFQQLTVLRTLVRDLNLEVDIVGSPLVREADGLAMSSRNRLLSRDERSRARAIYRALSSAEVLFRGGEHRASALVDGMHRVLAEAEIAPEYAELRAFADLRPLERADIPCLLLTAARVGRTRLIDNVVLSRPESAASAPAKPTLR